MNSTTSLGWLSCWGWTVETQLQLPPARVRSPVFIYSTAFSAGLLRVCGPWSRSMFARVGLESESPGEEQERVLLGELHLLQRQEQLRLREVRGGRPWLPCWRGGRGTL